MDFGVGLVFAGCCGWGDVGVISVVSGVFSMWLLVWKAGPSGAEAVSLFMATLACETNLERPSAALFLALDIHSKLMLYVANSRLHLFTLLFHFSHLRTWLRVCGHF